MSAVRGYTLLEVRREAGLEALERLVEASITLGDDGVVVWRWSVLVARVERLDLVQHGIHRAGHAIALAVAGDAVTTKAADATEQQSRSAKQHGGDCSR